MKYKCNRSFTTKEGKRYAYGDTIDSYDYNKLPLVEQTNFSKVEESSTWGSPSSNPAMGDIFGSGIPGGYDSDYTTLI